MFITRGARGSVMVNENGVTDVYGLMIISKVDPVGCRRQLSLAGAASALAAGYSLKQPRKSGLMLPVLPFRNFSKPEPHARKKLFNIGTDPDFVYSPELAEDIRHAQLFETIRKLKSVNEWD